MLQVETRSYMVLHCNLQKRFTPVALESHSRMAMTGKPQNPHNEGAMMSASESYRKQ